MARIVVLEDEASTRRLIVAVLKKAGHEVIDFDNGAEGLLNVLAELPDVVVSDVEMPKINGFEVLSDIRNAPETATTPVILLTSLSSQADIVRGMSQGANDYLTKPFDPVKLMEAVNKQLARLASQLGGQAAQLGAGFEATAPAELSLMPLGTTQSKMTMPATSSEPLVARKPAEPVQDRHAHLPRQPMGDAWAVSMEVHNDQALRHALPIKAWRALLRQLFMPVSKDAALRAADYLDLDESRLILYFLDQSKEGGAGYVRAAQAIQAMLRSGRDAKQWAATQFQGIPVPSIRVLTSLHLGPIEVVRLPLDFGGERDSVVGPTTDFMHRLREGEPQVMWRVLGTQAAVTASPTTYRLGAHMEVNVGGHEVLVHALQEMNPAYSLGESLSASDWI
jgi:DNA-binding response OmpR family regulator